MAEKKTSQRATKSKPAKSASTRAGEFVRDRIPRGLRDVFMSGARRIGAKLSPQMETRAPDVPEHPTPMERVVESSRRLRGEKEPTARDAAEEKTAAPRKRPTKRAAKKRAATKRPTGGARKTTKGERRTAPGKRAAPAKAAAGARKSAAGKAKAPSKRAGATKRAASKGKAASARSGRRAGPRD